jgi:hypothetical protein
MLDRALQSLPLSKSTVGTEPIEAWPELASLVHRFRLVAHEHTAGDRRSVLPWVRRSSVPSSGLLTFAGTYYLARVCSG